jgi:hypothetical protein
VRRGNLLTQKMNRRDRNENLRLLVAYARLQKKILKYVHISRDGKPTFLERVRIDGEESIEL